MEFIALDIETTGLNLEKSQVLEIGAIHVKDGKEVSRFQRVVYHAYFTYAESFAMKLNAGILGEMGAIGTVPLSTVISHFRSFLGDSRFGGTGKITIAGKNAGNFDIPILRANGFDMSMFSHRVLDVGSLWLPDFGYIPNLGEINEKLGRPKVSHRAIGDCEDVVAAVLAKVPNGGSK